MRILGARDVLESTMHRRDTHNIVGKRALGVALRPGDLKEGGDSAEIPIVPDRRKYPPCPR